MTRLLPSNVHRLQPKRFQLIAYIGAARKVQHIAYNTGYTLLADLYPTIPPTARWCLVVGDDQTYWVFNITDVMRTTFEEFFLDQSALRFKDWNAALAALQMEGA